MENGVHTQTISLWTDILCRKGEFANNKYRPVPKGKEHTLRLNYSMR